VRGRSHGSLSRGVDPSSSSPGATGTASRIISGASPRVCYPEGLRADSTEAASADCNALFRHALGDRLVIPLPGRDFCPKAYPGMFQRTLRKNPVNPRATDSNPSIRETHSRDHSRQCPHPRRSSSRMCCATASDRAMNRAPGVRCEAVHHPDRARVLPTIADRRGGTVPMRHVFPSREHGGSKHLIIKLLCLFPGLSGSP